ncbi:Polyketide cyclase / dehydrase and lipid transport [compost metagenome]
MRSLVNPDGDAIVERLEAFDNSARSYTYSILQAPFPVTGYRSTLRVVGIDGDQASRVEWSGQFTPAGVSDDDASRLFEGIYRDGVKALEATLAGAAS